MKWKFNSFLWRHRILQWSFGNLAIDITPSASSLESALASALQKNYLYLQKLFWKSRIFMLFLVLTYGISTTLLQMVISLRFPIHPFKGVHWCSRKRIFEFSEASTHWCCVKRIAPNVSVYSPARHPGWSPV